MDSRARHYLGMGDPIRIRIFDTSLRDGEQAPGFSMTAPEKVRMARQLDALGVDIIEAGFPIASDGDFEAVRAIAAEVRRPAIAGLARAITDDVNRAGAALARANHPRIHVFLATSDLHLRDKLRIDRARCLEQATAAVRLARTFADDVEFSAEDATRSDLAFLCDVSAAVVEAGATTVNLPDTVGYALPDDIGAMFRAVRRVLTAGGAFVFSLLHPCFEAPFHEPDAPQFLTGPEGTPTAYTLRQYAREGAWQSGGTGVRGRVGAYHRTLSTLINDLLAAGFVLQQLHEPTVRAPGLFAQVPRTLMVSARAG